jgi:hypothetical protein
MYLAGWTMKNRVGIDPKRRQLAGPRCVAVSPYIEEAEPLPSPREVPLQKPFKLSERLLKRDATSFRADFEFHDSGMRWPENAVIADG